MNAGISPLKTYKIMEYPTITHTHTQPTVHVHFFKVFLHTLTVDLQRKKELNDTLILQDKHTHIHLHYQYPSCVFVQHSLMECVQLLSFFLSHLFHLRFLSDKRLFYNLASFAYSLNPLFLLFKQHCNTADCNGGRGSTQLH